MKDVKRRTMARYCLALMDPWHTVIDGMEIEFFACTIIDVFTGWVEILPIQTKNGSDQRPVDS